MEDPILHPAPDASLAAHLALASAPAIAERSRCAECGGDFPKGEMMPFPSYYVCATCKPLAVRKAQDGKRIGRMWRKGRELGTIREHTLPPVCVKCNTPTDRAPLKRQLHWHSPAFYLLFFLNPLIYILVAIFVRRRAILHVGLCEKHARRRFRAIWAGWGLALSGCALIVVGAIQSSPWSFLGILLLLGGLLYGVGVSQVTTARKIDRETVIVRGVCADYLVGLPDWLAR